MSTNKPSRLTRLRDIVTFVLGWGLVWHQAVLVKPEEVNETFLLLAAALLGVPFGAEAVNRIRGGGTTGAESSSRQSESSSSPSSSSGVPE